MKGMLAYTIYYLNVLVPGRGKVEGITFEDAVTHVENLRKGADVRGVEALFHPYTVQV